MSDSERIVELEKLIREQEGRIAERENAVKIARGLLDRAEAELTRNTVKAARYMAERDAAIKQHYELLYAVAQKYPGESRHETALRYIREREQGCAMQGNAEGSTALAAREEKG